MTDVPKILIVDDEQSICYVLKVNLELEGFSVDTAFSAEEALAKRLERYDLFLLDVMMEHMSGFDLAKVIRGREELNAIPIISAQRRTRRRTCWKDSTMAPTTTFANLFQCVNWWQE